MKNKFLYSALVVLLLSLVQFNLQNALGEKIDYKKIFENECRKCHERDGRGTKRGKGLGVPDFTDAEWQASVTDEQLIKSITVGKKKMPKQEGRLSPEEIKAMVRYIRFFGPKKRR
jgi:cytochrome c6